MAENLKTLPRESVPLARWSLRKGSGGWSRRDILQAEGTGFHKASGNEGFGARKAPCPRQPIRTKFQ